MDFLIVDGEIVKKEDFNPGLFYESDPFLIRQKTWFGFGGIPLFTKNIELIENQAGKLQLNLPELFSDKRELFRISKRLLNKNKCYRSGYIHIQIFWNKNEIHSVIFSEALSEFDFPYSPKGILLTFSNQRKTASNSFNRFAFFNRNLWEASCAEIRNSPFQNSVILNEKNEVCECTFANIFLIKGNVLITPSLKSGCFSDILRPIVLKNAKKAGFNLSEANHLGKDGLTEMDEIFIASEETGIQWVLGLGNKRFLHQETDTIYEKINDFLKAKVKI